MIWQEWGSPPRMRGKAEPKRLWQLSGGITPAYAGKSNLLPHTRCRSWDHPRICGEKVLWRIDWLVCVGITPAYAGKRFSCKSGEKQVGDHPRVCGEKFSPAVAIQFSKGSPPRMRGKVVTVDRNQIALGITPAYAGKSPSTCPLFLPCWDHPRVCGEKCA